MSKIEEAFRGLGRTEKVRFISQNIEYANAVAVASYVKGYLFDVLNDVGDDEFYRFVFDNDDSLFTVFCREDVVFFTQQAYHELQ